MESQYNGDKFLSYSLYYHCLHCRYIVCRAIREKAKNSYQQHCKNQDNFNMTKSLHKVFFLALVHDTRIT